MTPFATLKLQHSCNVKELIDLFTTIVLIGAIMRCYREEVKAFVGGRERSPGGVCVFWKRGTAV